MKKINLLMVLAIVAMLLPLQSAKAQDVAIYRIIMKDAYQSVRSAFPDMRPVGNIAARTEIDPLMQTTLAGHDIQLLSDGRLFIATYLMQRGAPRSQYALVEVGLVSQQFGPKLRQIVTNAVDRNIRPLEGVTDVRRGSQTEVLFDGGIYTGSKSGPAHLISFTVGPKTRGLAEALENTINQIEKESSY